MNALERLADADAAAPLDPQTREWRDQVREMSYDIEDCVDEYMGQLRRRSGGGGVVNESRIASKSQDYQRHRANRQEEHLLHPRPFPATAAQTAGSSGSQMLRLRPDLGELQRRQGRGEGFGSSTAEGSGVDRGRRPAG
ncbi:hypothetical protein ZWY2020_041799 [Hordeum vulgare]|nr:hypothetical protein ZWY2020_041799 [Hordeum vulgare]